MYYQVPSRPTKAEKPKPIFPWEEHAPKATRVFPDERPMTPEPEAEPEVGAEPGPVPEPEGEVEPSTTARTSSDASELPGLSRESRSSSTSVSEIDPWNSYTRANAWDAMPEIERYVQAFAQSRKGKVQVLHQAGSSSTKGAGPLTSPPTDIRRPSMKLTDFPTEFERPSLPVTPAPRRPSFWGEEKADEEGELPTAEGVPKQEDWVSGFSSYNFQPSFASSSASTSASAAISATLRTLSWRCQFCGKQNPVQKLEELQKRQAEVLQTGPELKPKELPKRAMPSSAVATLPTAAVLGGEDLPAGEDLTPGEDGLEDEKKKEKKPGLEEAEAADEESRAVANDPSPSPSKSPSQPKSILKEPSLELGVTGSGGLVQASQ
jgi:hypothetical protein